MKNYYVYIMANESLVLYIGVTSNLMARVYQHRNGLIEGFTKKYGLKKLLYYEETQSVESALNREKRLKHWNRQWKLDLIAKTNPEFDDLYPGLYDPPIKSEDDSRRGDSSEEGRRGDNSRGQDNSQDDSGSGVRSQGESRGGKSGNSIKDNL